MRGKSARAPVSPGVKCIGLGMDEHKNSFLPGLDKRKYFLFVLLNFIVISLILLGTGILRLNFLYISTVIIAILLIQYPFLLKYKRGLSRLGIFYLAFIVFCFSLNFADVFAKWNQLSGIDSIVGLFMRGGFFIIAGHLYGLIYFPAVLSLNWCLRKVYL
jgi:hypothetical protein